jgi:multidrug efflux pump subunit AcrA (membrane-fusion protein)
VVVVGPGGYEVVAGVPVADVGQVKPGEDAVIRPDGTDSDLGGKVASIGLNPSTNGSTTTYPVVIGLSGSPSGLRNGASATVKITLDQRTAVLAVPTSAVRTVAGGALHVVTLVAGSTRSTVPVGVGAVGPDLTEVTSGLQEGQTVALADLHQPLPSSTGFNTRPGFGGPLGGGFGGSFGGGAGAGRRFGA